MTSAKASDGPVAAAGRRAEILEFASELFARQGYQRTTLTDLARSADMAKATLFHYFTTKELILFELYTRAMDMALSRVAAIPCAGDPAVELKQMLREHALLIMQNQPLFRVFFGEESGLDPQHHEKVRAQQADYVNRIADRVRSLQQEGRVAAGLHPRVAAQSMLGIGSWTYKWYENNGAIPAEDIAEFVADLALSGLLRSARLPAPHPVSGPRSRQRDRDAARVRQLPTMWRCPVRRRCTSRHPACASRCAAAGAARSR
jgi:TetR/AcrR family transcriptional regulator, cholesterol catabolism regulator